MSGVRGALARFIRWVMGDVAYHRSYPATVERFSGAGTVDLSIEPPSPVAGSMQGVPILVGIPGTETEPGPGARCLVSFEAGDPRRPYVAEWDTNAPGTLRLGGSRPLARMSDIVEVKLPPVVTVTGVVSGTMTIPGSPPVIVPIPATPLTGGVATLAIPPSAQVQTGNPQLLA